MNDTPAQVTAPGWYPDPLRRAPLRYWSGQGWTTWLASGATVWVDDGPVRRALVPGDLAALRFVQEIFLPEAQDKAQLSAGLAAELAALAAELSVEARRGPATSFVGPLV
ncbi:DUF2510 domain-containing protein, partial [Pengzhenrongella sp.]|uniref:DUF2510 domain-containing protein n=1 Tax=Pengzhenrongella sp. TaxID=2888820 RepID=UPI002F9551D7